MKRLHWQLAVGLFLGLAACNGTQTVKVHPTLSVDPTPIDFGNQPVLTPATKVVTISNIGKGTLHFATAIKTTSAMDLPGDPTDAGSSADAGDTDAGMSADAGDVDAGGLDAGTSDDAGTGDGGFDSDVFKISFPEGASTSELLSGGSVDVTITFVASKRGAYTGTFTVTTTDDPDPTHKEIDIPLKGNATTAASLQLSPSDCIDFGRVIEGQTLVRQLTVTSVGTAPLDIGQLSISGPSAAAFGIFGSNAGGTVDVTTPPSSVDINVKFAPQSTLTNDNGSFTADLNFSTNDPDHRLVDICLKGTINKIPIAVAQVTAPHPGQTMYPPNTTITLDGTMSSDPDNDLPLKYKWTIINKPQGSNAGFLPDDTSPTVTIQPDQPGGYTVALTVTDNAGAASKPARLSLVAATDQDVRVELIWDTPIGDLDLHMRPVGTMLNSESDCYGYNPDPMNWGGMFPPHHSGDKLSGFGPEDIDYPSPANGKYQITVVYASTQGASNPQLTATVRVYEYGTIKSELSKTMSMAGETWDAAVLDWPSGNVTPGTGAP